MSKFRAILITGLPGSGKGTQAELLRTYGLHPISAGVMIRGADPNSAIGKRIAYAIEHGTFIEDEDVMALFDEYIEKHKLNQKKDVLLLDGFPPRKEQVPLITKRVDINPIIYLDSKNLDVLVKRALARGERPYEKTEHAARERLMQYAASIPDMLACFPKENVLTISSIDTHGNERNVNEVHDNIVNALRKNSDFKALNLFDSTK